MNEHTKEYKKINKILTLCEKGRYNLLEANWCSDRICWAYKFHQITEAEMSELTERMTKYYKEDI